MAREPEEWIPPEPSKSQSREARALAVERDRLVRSRSVAKDTLLNLPVSVSMPDGEERYRTAPPPPQPQTRNYDPNREITRGYIQAPPNKTVWDSPDWRDSNPTVAKSNSCSSSSSQPRPKSSSTGQLSGWGLHWNRSGKSPPSHNRTRHHHQRHSHPSNSKNSSASSAANHNNNSSCKHKSLSSQAPTTAAATPPPPALLSPSSSSSLLTSVCGVIGVIHSPAVMTTTNSSPSSSTSSSSSSSTSLSLSGSPSGMLSSLGGRIQNAFSEKVYLSASCSDSSAWTVPTNDSPNSAVSAKIMDEAKSCLLQSSKAYCGNNRIREVGKHQQQSTHSRLLSNQPEPRPSSSMATASWQSSASSSSSSSSSSSYARLPPQQPPESQQQLPAASSSSSSSIAEENDSDSSGSDSTVRTRTCRVSWQPSASPPSRSWSSSSSPLTDLRTSMPPAPAEVALETVEGDLPDNISSRSRMCASDSATTSSSSPSSTNCENLMTSYSVTSGSTSAREGSSRSSSTNSSSRVLESAWEGYGQDKLCSVNNNNSNGGTRPRIREQCGDIQCRLEDLSSDPKDLQPEQDIRFDNTSGCEPLS